jgi:hypothetical protein
MRQCGMQLQVLGGADKHRLAQRSCRPSGQQRLHDQQRPPRRWRATLAARPPGEPEAGRGHDGQTIFA